VQKPRSGTPAFVESPAVHNAVTEEPVLRLLVDTAGRVRPVAQVPDVKLNWLTSKGQSVAGYFEVRKNLTVVSLPEDTRTIEFTTESEIN
jgi:hypothetical protein